MTQKLITIEHARKRLGKRAEMLTDKEVGDILNLLRFLCNKVIDSVVEKEGNN